MSISSAPPSAALDLASRRCSVFLWVAAAVSSAVYLARRSLTLALSASFSSSVAAAHFILLASACWMLRLSFRTLCQRVSSSGERFLRPFRDT